MTVETEDRSSYSPRLNTGAARKLLTGGYADSAFIFALIVVQLFINDTWAYTSIYVLDSWFYVGYGLHYLDPHFLNDYYKVSRLPWVLTEFAVRSLVPGYLASWILHVLTLLIGGVSLHLLFRKLFDRLTGLIAAALFVTLTFAHSNGGADYHNDMSGALFALTWFLAIRSALAAKDTFIQLTVVGVAAALAVHTNVLVVNLAPYVVIHWYLTSRWAGRTPAVGTFIAAVAIGGIACTLVLGAINWSVGRGFLFFMKQFALATSFVADNSQQTPWWHPWSSGFFWDHRFFALLVGASLTSVVGILSEVIGWRRQVDRRRLFLWFGYLSSFGIWIAWQTAGQTALDFDYFSYPLVFPLVGAVVACVPQLRGSSELWGTPWMAAVYGALALAVLFPLLHDPGWFALLLSFGFSTFSAVALLLFAGTLVVRFARPTLVALVVGVPLIAIGDFTSDSPGRFVYQSCTFARDWESVVIQANRLLYQLQPDYNVRIWFDIYADDRVPSSEIVRSNCPAGHATFANFGFSLVSTGYYYLGNPWSTPHSLDSLDGQTIADLRKAHALLVYITADKERIEAFKARFAEAGTPVEPLPSYEIRAGASALPLTAFRFTQ